MQLEKCDYTERALLSLSVKRRVAEIRVGKVIYFVDFSNTATAFF